MNSPTLSPPPSSSLALRFSLSFALVGLIWLTGLAGHFTPWLEWPALFVYVAGSLGLVLFLGRTGTGRQEIWLAGGNAGRSLYWGTLAGAVLFIMDITNTILYYKSGGAPMVEMERLLVHRSLLYLFPILILAEEFLWRGVMFSSLIEKGVNPHLTVLLTTILYALNHFAVAPVGMRERALMAMMAVPIGVLGGYLVLKTRNVWGSVIVHMITMVAMVLDIFVIPQLLFNP
ncbi:CPBP family intramembrane glutamic endopeptidase [Chlorobium phaeovibrioides]|uniref:CPBP family intramembrane metalloprotease n=1 Tax=Chlorobium phaeovibrioides TaxID=1094 RepID=A0A432AVS8_CHLPH|nr:CPBP family intramembrane glutamic endopeptidase [Chlorobium phaeovibrioides]QEQ57264.1 CPBP family intramembrane metalloprotease [Chlorobium phaeovibrioides]RTY38390.1 CPBP family intramembrane metalloprotease [Chlorobium phaeovibrioides]